MSINWMAFRRRSTGYWMNYRLPLASKLWKLFTGWMRSQSFNSHHSIMTTAMLLELRLQRAPDAAYNSPREDQPAPYYLHDTRVSLLSAITAWYKNEVPKPARLLWLHGPAGTGKSTIARKVAEVADKDGILGGSFFFYRENEELRDPSSFFPTIAYQLAFFDPVYGEAIEGAVSREAYAGHWPIRDQLQKLIIDPLRGLPESSKTVLIVVDAIDVSKSKDPQAASTILQLLMDDALHDNLPFKLRILVTSRTDSQYQTIFSSGLYRKRVAILDAGEVDAEDIKRYLETSLKAVPSSMNLTSDTYWNWPDAKPLAALVQRSGKLFIYAATVARFISDPTYRSPQKRLEVVLGLRQDTADAANPYAALDGLYLQVLRDALPEGRDPDDITAFKQIVGSMVLLREPMTINTLTILSSTETAPLQSQDNVVYRLHSIILAPLEPNEYAVPRFHHPSFAEFITNSDRCTTPDFFIDIPRHERRLTVCCLQLMIDSLDFSEDGITMAHVRHVKLPPLMSPSERRKTWHIPEMHSHYSHLYWASHLSEVPAGDEEVVRHFATFITQHLKAWFDAVVQAGVQSLAVYLSIKVALEWAQQSCCAAEVLEALQDAEKSTSIYHARVVEQNERELEHRRMSNPNGQTRRENAQRRTHTA
ncbi:hypothetical protein FA95DRAFT_56888 [Auriscalpium vulgare]|uniref:Uncharacterized protein n=1 Tax=Auriscalpium vulgare TaxID=40419 RepID=A0ACB8S7H8_9AGAM|nr:hypothetical protein FA95DRAFT_56888 [Auriscalpium vulgare]